MKNYTKKLRQTTQKNLNKKKMRLDEVYKETSNAGQNLVRKNRKTNFEEKLNVNTANSKNFKKN